jgi:PTH1 family peptidyl-tRNA hydrolase
VRVILGLGNPGLRYKFSRHNLGFLVVEKLAKNNSIEINQKALNCLLGKGRIEGQQAFLAKPLTFMNLSGEAVAQIVKRKKTKFEDLLIICDDVNLPLGKIRIRAKGTDGGHKGLRSIIEALGSKDFPRLRIGVGTPQVVAEKVAFTRHLLGRFNKKEIEIVNEAIERAVSCCEVWAKVGILAAMNRFN